MLSQTPGTQSGPPQLVHGASSTHPRGTLSWGSILPGICTPQHTPSPGSKGASQVVTHTRNFIQEPPEVTAGEEGSTRHPDSFSPPQARFQSVTPRGSARSCLSSPWHLSLFRLPPSRIFTALPLVLGGNSPLPASLPSPFRHQSVWSESLRDVP